MVRKIEGKTPYETEPESVFPLWVMPEQARGAYRALACATIGRHGLQWDEDGGPGQFGGLQKLLDDIVDGATPQCKNKRRMVCGVEASLSGASTGSMGEAALRFICPLKLRATEDDASEYESTCLAHHAQAKDQVTAYVTGLTTGRAQAEAEVGPYLSTI